MVQKLSFASDFAIAEGNSDLAVAELESEWTAMAQVDKDTWLTNTPFGTDDLDGKMLFMAYYMGTFVGDYDEATAYTSTTLGAGTGSDYTARASRTWTAA